jgi:predicted small secreted protein
MNRQTIAKISAVVITVVLVAILLSFANTNDGDEYGKG